MESDEGRRKKHAVRVAFQRYLIPSSAHLGLNP